MILKQSGGVFLLNYSILKQFEWKKRRDSWSLSWNSALGNQSVYISHEIRRLTQPRLCVCVVFRGSGPDGALVPGPAGSEDSLSGVRELHREERRLPGHQCPSVGWPTQQPRRPRREWGFIQQLFSFKSCMALLSLVSLPPTSSTFLQYLFTQFNLALGIKM